MADELGPPGSPRPVGTLSLLGMLCLAGSLPISTRRPFRGFPLGKQGLPDLSLAPTNPEVRTHPSTLLWGIQAAWGAEETINWEASIDSLGDQVQIISGPQPETDGDGVSTPQGCQCVVLGKLSGVFYCSSPLCLFEVCTGTIKTGLKARNKGLCQSWKPGRAKER